METEKTQSKAYQGKKTLKNNKKQGVPLAKMNDDPQLSTIYHDSGNELVYLDCAGCDQRTGVDKQDEDKYELKVLMVDAFVKKAKSVKAIVYITKHDDSANYFLEKIQELDKLLDFKTKGTKNILWALTGVPEGLDEDYIINKLKAIKKLKLSLRQKYNEAKWASSLVGKQCILLTAIPRAYRRECICSRFCK